MQDAADAVAAMGQGVPLAPAGVAEIPNDAELRFKTVSIGLKKARRATTARIVTAVMEDNGPVSWGGDDALAAHGAERGRDVEERGLRHGLPMSKDRCP